jgi:hypothetical protein
VRRYYLELSEKTSMCFTSVKVGHLLCMWFGSSSWSFFGGNISVNNQSLACCINKLRSASFLDVLEIGAQRTVRFRGREMEKALNRQRVLLQHLQPTSSFPTGSTQTHESAALSVSLFPFMKTVGLSLQYIVFHCLFFYWF